MILRRSAVRLAQLSMVVLAVVAMTMANDVAVTAQAEPARRSGGLQPGDRWDTFVADIAVRRHLLSADGAPSAEAPTLHYRWTRSQRQNGWTSRMDLTNASAPTIQSANGRLLAIDPTAIGRVEDDEDGTPPRVYDRRGQIVRLPSIDDRRVLGTPVAGSLHLPELPEVDSSRATRRSSTGREWVDAFIAAPTQASVRRDSLRRGFGPSAGRVRHLDRFVRSDATGTTEVLADTATGLPVEINVVHDGVLTTQSTLDYLVGAGGVRVRRSVRTEQRVVATSASRAVAVVNWSNLRLEHRGVR